MKYPPAWISEWQDKLICVMALPVILHTKLPAGWPRLVTFPLALAAMGLWLIPVFLLFPVWIALVSVEMCYDD